MADSKLAAELASQIARMILGDLDAVSSAVDLGVGETSLNYNVKFSRDKAGELAAKITEKPGIPRPHVELKLVSVSGQLMLFDGAGE